MSGFHTDIGYVDLLGEQLIQQAEDKPISENFFTYTDRINSRGDHNNLDVMLMETSIPLRWSDSKKKTRLVNLLMNVYKTLGHSFGQNYKFHISFTYCIARNHIDRPTTYSLFVGHNNRTNVYSPICRVESYLADPRDIIEFSEIFFNMDFEDLALKLFMESTSPSTKAHIYKIYLMVISLIM